jgi:erythromycin esterase
MCEDYSQQHFITWAKAHAIPLTTVGRGSGIDDLQPLKPIVNQAQVVALGESGHGIHESLAFRNRLWAFLVKNMGFTAIAAETGFSESLLVDDYILGKNVDSDTAIRSVFTWGDSVWKENQELIEWMRQYNAKPTTSRKIRFYGLDLTGGVQGRFARCRRALDAVLAYIGQSDSSLVKQVGQPLEPFLARFNDNDYRNLTPNERNSLTAAISDLIALLEHQRVTFFAQTSELAYHRAHRNAVVARQLDALFRANPNGFNPDVPQIDAAPAQTARDAAMADNLRWVLEREGPKGRVFIFAHNWHIKKTRNYPKEVYPELFLGEPHIPMGEHLNSMLGNGIVVLGFAFGQGREESEFPPADSTSIDGTLALLELPLFVLDLRTAPDEGFGVKWLNYRRKMRVNDRYVELNPIEAFDALVFVDTVSGVHTSH